MNHIEKKRQLEKVIETAILPLIDGNYVLYGLPYYNNIGDTLIWEGEIELLKKVKHKCVGTCGWNEYPCTKLPEDIVILITGGGYFGDLWRDGWDAVLKGIEPNKNNRIIILPNTLYYQDEGLLRKDAEYLSQFSNLIICARDKVSYNIARKYFKYKGLLVPDMAFCMNERKLMKWSGRKAVKESLLFMRKDHEAPEIDGLDLIGNTLEKSDWLTMEGNNSAEIRFYRTLRYVQSISRRIDKGIYTRATRWMYRNWYRPLMTNTGVRQLSSYRQLYVTRLHAMILGVLLGREVRMIDNKYGKLSSYYDTWLTDCDNVSPL